MLRAAAPVCSLSYIATHPLAFPQAHLAFSRRQPLANTQPGDWAAPPIPPVLGTSLLIVEFRLLMMIPSQVPPSRVALLPLTLPK